MGPRRRQDPAAGDTLRWSIRCGAASLALAILLTAAPAQATPSPSASWTKVGEQWPGQHRWLAFRAVWLDKRGLSLTCPGPVGPDVITCDQWRLNHEAWVGWARERTRIAQARASTTIIPAAVGIPASAGATYSGSVPGLIRSIFGPSASGCAIAIAYRESRFNPSAKNPNSSASGVFQLLSGWWDSVWHFNPFDAYQNVYHAHLIYESSGWSAWGGC